VSTQKFSSDVRLECTFGSHLDKGNSEIECFYFLGRSCSRCSTVLRFHFSGIRNPARTATAAILLLKSFCRVQKAVESSCRSEKSSYIDTYDLSRERAQKLQVARILVATKANTRNTFVTWCFRTRQVGYHNKVFWSAVAYRMPALTSSRPQERICTARIPIAGESRRKCL
jgi:hypothetical protein